MLFVRFTGYSREDVVGRSLKLLKSDRHPSEFYDAMWKSLNRSGHWQGEIWNSRKNGEVYPEWFSISAVRDAGGGITHFVGVFIDIGKLVGAQEKLRHLFRTFNLPLSVGGNKVLVSASIGISLFPIDGHQTDGLIRDARVAKDEADLQGRNTTDSSRHR